MDIYSTITKILTLLVIISVIAACGQEDIERPSVEVIVYPVKEVPHKPRTTFVGRLSAVRDVAIQAKVSGYIKAIHFQEGSDVQKGELLYEIEDSEFKSALNNAKAGVARAKASLEVATKNFKRGEELSPQGHISKSEMDKLEGAKLEAEAAMKSAMAKLETAKVNLSYTKILAPISGKIDRSKFSKGNLVGPDTGALTTLVDVDSMEIPFQIGETLYWEFVMQRQQNQQNGSNQQQASQPPIIRIELPNRDIYPHEGAITFVSNRVDPKTGTLELRASVPNPDGLLKPGQYAKVIVEASEDIPTLMIPQAAVQADQQGDFVMVIMPGDRVDRRDVQLGARVDTTVIVRHGLQVGEQIVVRGLQRIRPGQVVTAVEAPEAKE